MSPIILIGCIVAGLVFAGFARFLIRIFMVLTFACLIGKAQRTMDINRQVN